MNKIAVDTFLSYKFVSNPVVSPKGNYVAYFVKDTNIEKNNYNSNIWLYNVATGENKQLTVGDDAISFIWKEMIFFKWKSTVNLFKTGSHCSFLPFFIRINTNHIVSQV